MPMKRLLFGSLAFHGLSERVVFENARNCLFESRLGERCFRHRYPGTGLGLKRQLPKFQQKCRSPLRAIRIVACESRFEPSARGQKKRTLFIGCGVKAEQCMYKRIGLTCFDAGVVLEEQAERIAFCGVPESRQLSFECGQRAWAVRKCQSHIEPLMPIMGAPLVLRTHGYAESSRFAFGIASRKNRCGRQADTRVNCI